MEQIKKFEYKGNEITFQLGNDDTMINATEMAKVFGKRPSKWLELPSTISFLDSLTAIRKSDSVDFEAVKTVNGNNGGTWMHEDAAIEFARWLSPGFAVWCNDRIKELMKHGATALNPEDLLDPDYVISVMQTLKKERAEKELLEAENQKNKPLVDFAESVAVSKGCIEIGEFSKLIYSQTGMGRTKMFRWLKQNGILQYNKVPYQRYLQAGWFEVEEKPFKRGEKEEIGLKTLITGKGQIAVAKKLNVELPK